jgi:excisionase family DNA binding protein
MSSKPTKPLFIQIELRGNKISVEHVRQHLHQDWYTVKEVATLLGKHEKTVRKWLKEGKLRYYRPAPRSTYVTKEQLAEFLSRETFSVPLEGA